jgi:hypothetical protein
VADPAVRAPFEIDSVECVHVEAGAGNDFVFNDTAAESLLEGDAGNDILLGGSGRDILFGQDGLDALFGNGGDDFLFSDQDTDGTFFFNGGELLNGGPGTDVGTNNTIADVLVDLETIQFPVAAVATLNAAELDCDFMDLVTGEPIVFEAPMLMVTGGPLMEGQNTITISNALSNAVAVLLQGTALGAQNLTVQGQLLQTGLADPVAVAFGEVDSSGIAIININLTAEQLSQPLLFQGFQVLSEVQASAVVSLSGVNRGLSPDGESFDQAAESSAAHRAEQIDTDPTDAVIGEGLARRFDSPAETKGPANWNVGRNLTQSVSNTTAGKSQSAAVINASSTAAGSSSTEYNSVDSAQATGRDPATRPLARNAGPEDEALLESILDEIAEEVGDNWNAGR